jgi:hypothetical protein
MKATTDSTPIIGLDLGDRRLRGMGVPRDHAAFSG